MTLIIKECLPGETSAAKAVSAAAFERLHDIYRPTKQTLARQPERAPTATRLVAVQDETIVGTVQFDQHREHLHIIGLAVVPTHQRKGIAGRLIQEVIHRAKTTGIDTVVLDTIRETGNVRIFQSLGFDIFHEEITSDFESDRYPMLHEVKMKLECK